MSPHDPARCSQLVAHLCREHGSSGNLRDYCTCGTHHCRSRLLLDEYLAEPTRQEMKGQLDMLDLLDQGKGNE